MLDYQFDVFISYSRRGSASKWLMNHFYPKLQDCLADQIAPTPKVFLDTEMPRGVHWPAQLERALHRSKIMIAVLTPLYFESSWCMAELHSMYAREKMLGLAGAERPQGLIYPILYSDSENFPKEESLLRSWWDFKELAMPEMVFQESRDWISFHHRVTEFATDLVGLLQEVPDWRADWPVIERPNPVLIPPPRIPRFDL
ncbi:MAG TPA: TIR domain-containing protein [Pseudonocardiaceae bacterium]|nr:TIR domain-containing protein [Pseudonocardiaceae bacterium]